MNFSSNFQLGYTYTISIVYTGIINRDLNGLYLSDYVDVNGQDRVFMTSQMEPTHARRVLPCIDEPARKASFQISIQHDSTYTVWSNAEVERVDTLKDGQLVSHFHQTLNMSTFLLAMIMAPSSDFSCRPYRTINSTNIRSRVCGRVDILPQLAYADEVAYEVVEFFNKYFGIDYPLTKIEHFAVPDFTGGAMENYGKGYFYRSFHEYFSFLRFANIQ